MAFFRSLLQSLFHLGFFGPFAMGILDSSFLVLPFGNDLLVAGLVVNNHSAAGGYILSASCGSTIGALLLSLVSRKLGEKGITRFAGGRSYRRLKGHISGRGGIAIAVGALAPPPFPFTMVIAGTAALNYPLWRLLIINFFARAVRFTLLALLAIHFGSQLLRIAKSTGFEWTMIAFIALCVVTSGFSIARWLRRPVQA